MARHVETLIDIRDTLMKSLEDIVDELTDDDVKGIELEYVTLSASSRTEASIIPPAIAQDESYELSSSNEVSAIKPPMFELLDTGLDEEIEVATEHSNDESFSILTKPLNTTFEAS